MGTLWEFDGNDNDFLGTSNREKLHCSFVLQSYHEEELLALQDQRYYFLFQGFVIEKGIMYEESLI
jgi:hypothetical protein